MPRSVLTALAATLLLAFVGLADGGLRAWAWLAHRPPPDLLVSPSMDAWFVMGAVYLSSGTRRRDPRVRMPMFWITLAAAIILGVFLVPFVLMCALPGEGGETLAAVARTLITALIVACLAATAWGLSRPPAKLWFEAGRGRDAV